jgi:hypothetical protein
MGEPRKTVTSGPMTEKLVVSGKVTNVKTVGVSRVDLRVQLDDGIDVDLVPIDEVEIKKGDPVELALEVGAISITKRKR